MNLDLGEPLMRLFSEIKLISSEFELGTGILDLFL